ncbi:hypothetical protein OIB37_35140 [Streptomyces sp. NBC_00820]|uniref:hypothetical protein n=1 Tax=Streptomyces sp. NBC_00820 TaxID=2975842 RepID=UPI002ED00117|nr:hypothetical protein OIB37_35140 [Streptomyces sp. NBC_00820]
MYDPHEFLRVVDDHKVPVLIGGTITMLLNYAWFYEAIRVARKDRAFPVPAACLFLWFAHDGLFVWSYPLWFHTYDHWFLKLFWVAIVVTALCELLFLRDLLRYGRAETAPSLTQGRFRVGVVLAMAGVWVTWVVLHQVMNDPLNIYAFFVVNILYPVFGTAMTLRRGSRRGQTTMMWVYCTLETTAWVLTCVLFLGDMFRSWPWLSLGAVMILWTAAGAVLVHRSPSYAAQEPAPLSAQPA